MPKFMGAKTLRGLWGNIKFVLFHKAWAFVAIAGAGYVAGGLTWGLLVGWLAG